VVTSDRLLVRSADDSKWQSWSYRPGLALSRSDHSGVGTIELCDADSLLALWRYTLGADIAAGRLVDHFTANSPSSHRRSAAAVALALCPKCETPLLAGQEECPACSKEIHEPPSTWTLLRLGALPGPTRATAGRLRAVAVDHRGNAGGAVPDHADDGQGADPLPERQADRPRPGRALSLGPARSSLLAWVLGWGRTYILALVSERIGADLRTATYEHLLKLSQEYFGGKRTGDLMARIGSETDRINIFISLHLLDFATDVLMIVMTTAILVSIDPWLAASRCCRCRSSPG
jgi:ATP-binding cassette subfamily B protein